ncbi:MAG: exodeoxyribonuclease VII large subunit, partial [Bdellovibrionales bacterium]|nr:exodeoxyribonuclease VII large subunit [Bdellovibrionales bacterium]
KNKLKKEGLFDKDHKKSIPPLPSHIAIITSPTGAALRDILKILHRRFKGAQVTVIPALVQGTEAAKSLITALGQAQYLPIDALIIGRGGGSMEDLWAFNNEDLARAIHHCPIPVISAVGHEIDFTICDFVSDLRAPTPSAAAELVAQNAMDLLKRVESLGNQLVYNLKFHSNFWKEKFFSLEKQIKSPERLIQELYQKLDDWNHHLSMSLKQKLDRENIRVNNLEKVLESLNPLEVMKRGFCIAKKNGQVIANSQELTLKQKISLEFFKGQAEVVVVGKTP